MGSRPHAVLWYGTKAVETCPINPEQEWDDETDDVKPGNEPMEWKEQEAFEAKLKGLGVELVNFYGDGDPKYALALKGHLHETDWNDDLILTSLDAVHHPSAITVVRRAMTEVGWPDDGDAGLKWRLGAYYF